MLNNKKIHALIMARAGSKRLSGKNLLEIQCKSLLQIAINKALNSKYISRIYISTESEKIKSHVRQHYFGAVRIHIIDRPEMLAADNVTNLPVLKHAAKLIECDYIFQVDCCSPQFNEIDEMIEYGIQYDSCYCVKEAEIRTLKTGDVKRMHWYSTNNRIYKKSALLNAVSFVVGDSHLYLINRFIVDINLEQDFICAKALMEAGY